MMSRTRSIATAAFVLMLGAGVLAQQPAAPAAPPPELLNGLSAIWNRIDPVGSGSYDRIPIADPELRPEYKAKLPVEAYDGFGPPPPGWVPPKYDIRNQSTGPARCAVGGGGVGGGGGGVDVNSAGMALMASKDLVLMLRDGGQGARQIYVDGRSFPERFTGLYSIGRWENGALVVKTRGFTAGGVGLDRSYGRGWREPTTEVTETMRPSADGKRLVVTYTYEDPKVFVKPWVFELNFERLPVDQWSFESWCDSREWIAANPAPR
jgi:hypothetical protein